MNTACYKFVSSSLVLLALTACGGGSGGSSSTAPGTVSFAVSDAPVDDLAKVVITIDGIELQRKNDNCDVDSCDNQPVSIDRLIGDEDTVTIDLLDYQGSDSKIVVENILLEAGVYDQLRLSVIDQDINFSYVEEATGAIKLLKVPSGELKLGGFTVESGGVQVFVIEFDLRKAMTYNPSPERYILKPRGVRVVEVETAASIAGTVDTSLFDGAVPCDSKVDPTVGNVVYIYQGHDLDPAQLADNFNSSNPEANAPLDAIDPYASQTVAADGSYGIAYLPAGNYTLAFSCEAGDDDPEIYNGIVIPSPASEIVELSLSEGESESCNLPVENGDC